MPAATTWDSLLRHIDKNGPYSVVAGSNCWVWGGYTNHDGYGRVRWKRKLTMVHRLMYTQYVGEIPLGFELDHLCRNRACVNPTHLEPVLHKENMRRGISRCSKKVDCKRGHPLAGNNLYLDPTGARQCRKCDALWMKAFRAKKREEIASQSKGKA